MRNNDEWVALIHKIRWALRQAALGQITNVEALAKIDALTENRPACSICGHNLENGDCPNCNT